MKRLTVLILAIAVVAFVPLIVESKEAQQSGQAKKSPSPSGSACDDAKGVCNLPLSQSQIRFGYDKVVPLNFTLVDAYGREVRASDYRGVPILISTGACWCGGCQGDAEALRALEEKYWAKGLQMIRSVTYDNELPAWEFQKHYRLPYVQLLDPDREFEHQYNRDGWTFLMLVNPAGKVVYRENRIDWKNLPKRIESVLLEKCPVETVARDGISYMPATLIRSGETKKLHRIDRFPSLACAPDGRMYLVFTTNRGGTQDIYLRVFDGKKWLPVQPLAATAADEFDAAVVVDQKNQPWVSWTSNADGQHYNIFMTCATKPSGENEPIQITDSKKDAMHARMAVDAKGRIWVTYYKWERIFGRSRDKELYTRYLEQDRWSDEIHVNPEDILPADDHTDPAIAPFGDGVVIGWSWDFHHVPQNQGYSQVPKEPSIFLRSVKPGPKLGRARAVSGANIDTRPTIVLGSNGRVLCAWESVVKYRIKVIAASLENLQHNEQPGVGVYVTGPRHNICTPCLAISPKGDVTLVWAEALSTGKWLLKQAHWNSLKNVWTRPITLVSGGNPRFPSAAYSSNGDLWVAYCINKGDNREVAVLRKTGARSARRSP
ncbi:MAG: redoxin family protein [Thermoguttaceae bacterium]